MSDTSEESSSYTEESEEQGAAVDFKGNLKNSIIWDASSKQLRFRLRQSLENGRKVELKYKGQLQSDGTYTYSGHVRRKFLTNQPLTLQKVMVAAQEEQQGIRPSDSDIDPNSFLPGGLRALVLSDFILSPGLTFTSGQGRKLQYALTVHKAPQFLLHSPKFDAWVSGKAQLEVDPKTAKLSSTASLRLKLLRYSVTEKQDIRVSLGMDFAATGGRVSQMPYVKLSENNMAIKLQNKAWSFLYEL